MSNPGDAVRVRVAHVSMQFSDSTPQKKADADRLFKREADRGAWWVTGTEAGESALRTQLRAAARANGFRFFVDRSVWVAVAKERIRRGTWDTGYVDVLQSTDGAGHHGDRGIAWAQFENEDIGRVTVGCAHYLTRGRPDAVVPANKVNLDENQRLAEAIGEWGIEHGRGGALVFYAGDQNIVDRTNDTFLGRADFTTSWDELGKYEDTGHGNIDVISSFDADGRVSARSVRALDDTEFPLHTDHYLVEGAFDVKPSRL